MFFHPVRLIPCGTASAIGYSKSQMDSRGDVGSASFEGTGALEGASIRIGWTPGQPMPAGMNSTPDERRRQLFPHQSNRSLDEPLILLGDCAQPAPGTRRKTCRPAVRPRERGRASCGRSRGSRRSVGTRTRTGSRTSGTDPSDPDPSDSSSDTSDGSAHLAGEPS